MATQRQSHNPKPRISVGTTTAVLALAVLFVLTVAPGIANAQQYHLLYTFTGGLDGAQPYSGLTINGAGNLFGTTHSGNQGTNWGNVYELRRHNSSWIFSPLQLFDGTLASGVVIGPDGVLYGTSPNNLVDYFWGYVYNLRPPINTVCRAITCPWNPTVIYGFSGGSDGALPRYGDLTFDSAGNMYDTTANGGISFGSDGLGVVYQMTRSGSGWTQQPIYLFTGPDGAHPYNAVVLDGAGNLYGTTTAGGQFGFGTVFEVSPSGGGWTERVLYSFTGGDDGSFPTAPIVFDQAGNIYGSTNTGGAGGGGTVFELSPAGGGAYNYTLLKSFTGGVNCGPFAALTFDAVGNLFGTTICSGATNNGNVFKFTPSGGGGWTYSSLYDFTGGLDGKNPYSNVVFDSAGNMFGTTFHGGTFNQGVIWELTQ